VLNPQYPRNAIPTANRVIAPEEIAWTEPFGDAMCTLEG